MKWLKIIGEWIKRKLEFENIGLKKVVVKESLREFKNNR